YKVRHYESKKNAEDYRKYRPQTTVPTTVRSNYIRGQEYKFDYLLDVGCGAGRSANVFAPYSHDVLAIDPSENELKEARFLKQVHVTYKTGIAEELPVDDASVDVITAASVDVITAGTSVHWFVREKFFKEVDRVLKPGGRLVLFVYCLEINLTYFFINQKTNKICYTTSIHISW
uniref:Methyltransferase type 11 domain-containing protein n=1 Tax=Ciona intestinalis TaxID=7719 RepID=H2Y3J5_CIOIN